MSTPINAAAKAAAVASMLSLALPAICRVLTTPEALAVKGNGRIIFLSRLGEDGKPCREIKINESTGGGTVPAKAATKFLDQFGEGLAMEGIIVSIHDLDFNLLKHNGDYVKLYAGAAAQAALLGPGAADAPVIEAADAAPLIEGSLEDIEVPGGDDEAEIDAAMASAAA